MKSSLIPLLAALPLLACSPAADKADTGESIARDAGVGDGPTGRVGRPVAKGAEKGPIPDDIDEGVETAANSSANEAATAAKPTSIPTRFQGRWGLNANDCKPEFASAAKGLMVVNDSRLTFYESRGTLDRIDAWTPANRFTANYGFSGEGMTWERVITFERNGNKLRRTEKGGDEGPVDLTYTACPA
jgi:hypothetical protein